MIKYPKFKTKEGDIFIFPTVWSGQAKKMYKPEFEAWSWARLASIALDVKQDGWFESEVDENDIQNFDFIRTDMNSNGLQFGKTEVWIIGGPKFELIKEESMKNELSDNQ